VSQCEHPAGKCNNADDCAEHICAQPKQKPTLLWNLIDPGWREREVERYKALAAAMPVHKPLVEIGRRATPCGECHLQPGERCDICGARDVRG
jgi:hypothetical protein